MDGFLSLSLSADLETGFNLPAEYYAVDRGIQAVIGIWYLASDTVSN